MRKYLIALTLIVYPTDRALESANQLGAALDLIQQIAVQFADYLTYGNPI